MFACLLLLNCSSRSAIDRDAAQAVLLDALARDAFEYPHITGDPVFTDVGAEVEMKCTIQYVERGQQAVDAAVTARLVTTGGALRLKSYNVGAATPFAAISVPE